MDHSLPIKQDVGFDLESGTIIVHDNEDEILAKTIFTKLCDRFMSVDNNDCPVKSNVNPLNCNKHSPKNNVKLTDMKMVKEKRKKGSSAKKPPRPPRGFSLDACDQKLIKELTELALIKRARIERMKALKQKKSLKGSSSSSNGSLFAMLFTVIFFLVILLQGRNSGANFQGSPRTAQTNENGLILIQNQLNSSVLPNSK